MTSGNFLIGDDLSLEGFTQYVQPILEDRGYSVQDKLSVVPYANHRKIVLVSVVGEGDLEKGVNDALVEAGRIIEPEQMKQQTSGQNPIAWKHQVSTPGHRKGKEGKNNVCVEKGQYETVGTYHSDKTASQFFPSLAQEYLLKGVQLKIDEVEERIREFLGTKFSDLL